MSTKTNSRHGHDNIVQLPTGYEPDSYRINESKRLADKKRHEIRVHRAIAAVGATVFLAGVVEAGRLFTKSPVSAKSRAETEMLKNAQKRNESEPIDNRIYVFHEGVRWRKTPDMLDPNQDTPEVSNEAGHVGKGEVLIVERDLEGAVDSNADGWEAFRLVKDLNRPEGTAAGSPKELGKKLMWINMNELRGQSTPEGGSYLETYIPNSGPKTLKSLTAHITDKGDILLDFNDKPAAIGQVMSAEKANEFLQDYQPDQH
ncbi:MAG TPA: hypothetical protein VLF90_02850 [Patescibacteria group bacterium]|nr:hypothetical protein [Patescibacteria group bacterium]